MREVKSRLMILFNALATNNNVKCWFMYIVHFRFNGLSTWTQFENLL